MVKHKSKYRNCNHTFYFYDDFGKQFEVSAKVIPAMVPVDPILTSNHLRKSIRLKGRGNSQTCSGSICIIDNRGLFPHPVEGYCDFTDTRAWIMSKWETKKRGGGWHAECVEYEHSEGWLSKANDLRGGAQKLLEEFEKTGGNGRTLHLRPMPKSQLKIGKGGYRNNEPSRRDGSRTPKLRGAKLRRAHMNRGLAPST
jgi:hypothetical protein